MRNKKEYKKKKGKEKEEMKGVERGYKRDEDLSKGRHSSKTKKR